MHQPAIEFFTASDGYRLHYRRWRAAHDKPRGTIVALHGIQSHSGWYTASSRQLCEAGYDVLFLDRRGSGLNERSRGDALHADRLLNDVAQFLQWVRFTNDRGGQAPVILLSVSWGGKLAALTAARRPELLDGLALLYPGIRARIRATATQNLKLSLADIGGAQKKRVPIPLQDPSLFTTDPDWQTYISSDPLTLRDVTVGFLLANRQLDRQLLDAPECIVCPTLLMLAGQDRIIDNRATRGYFLRFASEKRKLIEYIDAAHTLEFEPNRDETVRDLLSWIDSIG
ncbi:Phospholipase YtpA [Symmachiella dynata]|uniref:alpha/beta hydrolase n=1 Tax=Symmachiella dynata TaxID=2527995 RepID=UPI00118A9E82|nr:alpha/beta fold hydrolase [Symmachiella dynata]QDT49507.1 Phospholipase YtpA [Symmachiella dynata]